MGRVSMLRIRGVGIRVGSAVRKREEGMDYCKRSVSFEYIIMY